MGRSGCSTGASGAAGRHRVGDRGQHLVVHLMSASACAGDLLALGHHQRRSDRPRSGRDICRRRRPASRSPPARGADRRARPRGSTRRGRRAGPRPRSCRCDDAGVGMCAAQRRAVQHALKVVVVGVEGRARHLLDGVRAGERLADLFQRRHHRGRQRGRGISPVRIFSAAARSPR